MKICSWDFETIKDSSRVDFLPEIKPDKRIVIPAKIEANIAKKKQEQIDKMALNPAFAIPCVFGWHDGNETHSLILEEETPAAEKDLLIKIWKELKKYEQFVTFNGMSYDVPVLLMRSMIHHVQPTVKISRKRYSNQNHCDVRMVFGDWDKFAVGKLPYFSMLLLGKSSKDELSGDQVQEYWDMDLKDDIAKYCEADCQVTFELYDLLSKYYL